MVHIGGAAHGNVSISKTSTQRDGGLLHTQPQQKQEGESAAGGGKATVCRGAAVASPCTQCF